MRFPCLIPQRGGGTDGLLHRHRHHVGHGGARGRGGHLQLRPGAALAEGQHGPDRGTVYPIPLGSESHQSDQTEPRTQLDGGCCLRMWINSYRRLILRESRPLPHPRHLLAPFLSGSRTNEESSSSEITNYLSELC